VKNDHKVVKEVTEENRNYKIFRILGVRKDVEIEAALIRYI